MRVGIDFDNTIVNTVEVSKKYLDEFMPGNNLKSYHELSYEKEREFFEKYSEIITENLSVFKNVKKAFSFFKKNDITLVMISKRGWDYEPLKNKTLEYLKNHNLKFDEVNIAITDKGKFCKLNNIDLLIDDLEIELKKVEDYGIRGLKYGSKSDRFDYALSWKDVIEYIRKGLDNDKNSRH